MIPSYTEGTIVAVSTAEGRGDRAIIRLSGPDAVRIVSGLFQGRGAVDWSQSYRVWQGDLRLGPDARLPTIAYVMLAPRSYTREDVVELHVPGAPVIVEMALRTIFNAADGKARAAMPGEFTRRAFLNGRIDLAQAEAVLATIRAASESELRCAVQALRGAPTRRIREIQSRLTRLRAQIEAALDFGDQDVELVPVEPVASEIAALARDLQSLVGAAAQPSAETGTVPVAIAGLPNAGKSTLFNALCGQDRSIVTPVPGTTRDAVSTTVELEGLAFRLVDTAGLAEFDSPLEREAVERARQCLEAARIVLFLHDASADFHDDEVQLLASLDPRRTVLVLSKSDLQPARSLESTTLSEHAWRALPVSAKLGKGIDAVKRLLVDMVQEGRVDLSGQGALVATRQREAARQALTALLDAQRCLADAMGYEFAALPLREAADSLGQITGEVTNEEILDEIFSRFCIGK